MSSGGALLRNVLSSIGGRLAATVLGVATFAILARAVGPHGLGQYRTVLTMVLFAGALFEFGLYPVLLQGLARGGDGTYVGQVVGLRLASSAAGVLLLGLLVQWLEPDPLVRLGVFVAGTGWIGQQLNEVLRALFQQRLARYASAIAETLGAAVTFSLVLAFGILGGGTDAMLLATALGMLATGAVAWRLALRRVRFRPLFDAVAWRRLLKAGLPFAGSALLLAVHFRIDVLLLSLWRPSIDVGLYDAPAKLYELVFMVPYLLGGALMPLFARDLEPPGGTLAPRLHAAAGVVLLYGLMVQALFLVHASHITALLGGPQFHASGPALRVLGAAAMLAGLCAVLRHAATAAARERAMVRVNLASVAAAVLLHCVLIPRWGILGAASGKLGGDAVRTLLTLWLLRDHVGFPAASGVLRALLPAAGFGGALWLLDLLGIHWLLAVAACSLLAGGACLALPSIRRGVVALSTG